MGTLSTVLTIEEYEIPGMETSLVINNEHLDFNSMTELKNKVNNIYQRGCTILKYPGNLDDRIS